MEPTTSEDSALPTLSVVVPCYGCEACLVPLHEALVAVLEPLVPSFEIVLVEDASKQGDWSVIARLAARDPRVRGVRLARNFGQHYAIAAGLEVVRGDWVVVMDCDLQDRPEEIPRLYAKAQEGYPCVFARRTQRRDASSTVWLSRAFNWVNGWLGGFEADPSVSNYSIVSRRVVQELRRFRESHRNYSLHVHWLGFPLAYVDVEHGERHAGQSTYTLARRARHAVSSVLTTSTKPLVLSAGLGLTMALGAAAVALCLLIRKFTVGVGVEGWTSVMVSLFFLFGVLFLNLGIVGLYLGSIFVELKGRPIYVVAETTFGDDERGGPSKKV
jgi:glycosyltransferase involved in cell wall biosynthesis